MSYIAGILIVVVGLLLSIGLHEVGHLLPAKKFGVRVPQYMIGFGPTIWSFTRGETEYGLKAIPLGGYVRLVGMYAPVKKESAPRQGRFAELIQSARDASDEEILPGEEHRAFYRLSAPKKIVIMFGGPFVNLVIAFVLSMAVMIGFGAEQPTTTLGSVSACVLPADAPADETCSDTSTPAPAHAAGFLPGDTIIKWGTTVVTDWDQLTSLIAGSGNTSVDVTYLREGATLTTQASPIVVKRPVTDAAGAPLVDDAGNQVVEDRGFMGFGPTVERKPVPVGDAIASFGDGLAATGKVILQLPQRLVDVAQVAFSGEERPADSPVGIVGVGRFAGEIAASEQVDGVLETSVWLVRLVANLNLALFAFNMIPLPPLDGGHIASALFEGGRRQFAKLRGAPDPGPADTAKLLPVAYGMFIVLMAMGALLIYADLVNPRKVFS